MLGFGSVHELLAYITFMCFGMSVMVVSNTVLSFLEFFLQFYLFAAKDGENIKLVTEEQKFFWNNVFTYYLATTFIVECLVVSLMLTNFGKRIPITLRLYIGLVFPIILVFSVMMVTIGKTTETGARVTIILIGLINGASTALCSSGAVALAGPFPTKFLSAYVWGVSVCGVITSTFAIVIKASTESNFKRTEDRVASRLTQSRIYFGLVMIMQSISCGLLLLLRKNPYAMKYTADFRYAARKGNAVEGDDAGDDNEPSSLGKGPADQDDDLKADCKAGKSNVMTSTVDPDTMRDTDQVENITNSQQMLKASALSVFRRVWPMLAVCFIAFFTAFLIYPGVFFAVKLGPDDNGWYMVIIPMMFNLGDFVARLFVQFKTLHASPLFVVIGTFARLLLVIPIVLCAYSVIKGTTFPYILCFLWSLTYGYVGGLAGVYAPRTGSLTTAGERSLAANWAVSSLLFGIFAGCMCALGVNSALPKDESQ
ncbi:adenosine transporter 1 [Trypanosoma equiperdum]|uniref:Adenosine transporter 2 n=2 Tax=Trypanozoon TaxID=39700 RepID=A0A1G4IHC5_TRYEQ|nr:adenosine transporter 1 [Trypanosoma equiperdum]